MGRSHARMLAAGGANVVIADLLSNEGSALAQEIGERTRFIRHDVTEAASWENLVAATEVAFGPVTSLVNNAGIGYVTPFDELTEADYRKFIDVNQVGVFLGMQAVLPSMRAPEAAR